VQDAAAFEVEVDSLGIGHFEPLRDVDDVARVEALLDTRASRALAVHGIGENGHLGLNEPGGGSGLRVLAPQTVRALFEAKLWHDREAPRGLTLGTNLLGRVGASLLLAFGARKRDALARLFARDASLPASALTRDGSLWVVCDPLAYGAVR